MEMAKISPEAPDAGGVHSTADDRTLIKNGCTAWYWAQVPRPGSGPGPGPGQTRLFTRFLHGQTKSQAQRAAKGKTGWGGERRGSEEPKNGFYWRVC